MVFYFILFYFNVKICNSDYFEIGWDMCIEFYTLEYVNIIKNCINILMGYIDFIGLF